MNNELTLAELDGELCEALPARTLLSHRRHMRRFRAKHVFVVRNHCDCDCGHGREFFNGGDGRFGDDGRFGGFFGGVSNFNSTRQSIFNPQTAIGFGGGNIAQVGGNTNFNNNLQFGI